MADEAENRNERYMPALNSLVPDSIRQRIRDCQTEDNWDDDDALGITPQACNVAIAFLETLSKHDRTIEMPGISSSVFGSVTLHWKNNGEHLVVRPSPDTYLAYYRYECPGKDSIYGDESKEQVIQRVLKFLRSKNAEQN